MVIKMLVIKADGTEQEIEQAKKPTLEQMQSIVGGYIEIVTTKDRRLMVLNEEGKLNGLPVNVKATAIYGNPFDVICGDVLVTDRKNID